MTCREFLDTEEGGGSNPPAPTAVLAAQRPVVGSDASLIVPWDARENPLCGPCWGLFVGLRRHIEATIRPGQGSAKGDRIGRQPIRRESREPARGHCLPAESGAAQGELRGDIDPADVMFGISGV